MMIRADGSLFRVSNANSPHFSPANDHALFSLFTPEPSATDQLEDAMQLNEDGQYEPEKVIQTAPGQPVGANWPDEAAWPGGDTHSANAIVNAFVALPESFADVLQTPARTSTEPPAKLAHSSASTTSLRRTRASHASDVIANPRHHKIIELAQNASAW
eukprot:2223116-Rhodomonas_salina.1